MAIHEEESLADKKISLGAEDSLSYIKLGFIGPAALEQAGFVPTNTLSLFRGFFIVGNFETLRAELHKIVDQGCDALEQARRENGQGK